MGHPEKKYFTVEEYLEFERNSTEKHEYYNGEIYAMSGASFAHNKIFSNVFGKLSLKLDNEKCTLFGSDLRTSIELNSKFVYPDMSIICEEPMFTDDKFDTVKNPKIIIEILSKTTRDYDLGTKFLFYRQIESLEEYLLIDSLETKIIKYHKQKNGSWILTETDSLDQSFTLNSIKVNMKVADIYKNVVFK